MPDVRFDKPHRLKNFDGTNFNYSAMGSYMVTFNTRNRNPVLSDIVCPDGNPENAQVRLSDIGTVLENYILRIPDHYHNVSVDKYVIMPDHVHIILTFCDDNYSAEYNNSRLSKIVHALKKLVTNTLGFSIWQLDYYDCVSFSEKAYDAFIAYVHNNLAVWYIKDKAEPDIPRK